MWNKIEILLRSFVIFGIVAATVDGYRYNYHWLEDDCLTPGRSIYLGRDNDSLSLYGFVRVNRNGGYSANLDCSMTVFAPDSYRLVVRIRRVEIDKPTTGSSCTLDYMSVVGNSSQLTYCGFGRPPYAILSTSNFLTFHMHSEPREWSTNWIGFDLYYTAFHQREECDGSADENGVRREFRCSSGYRCIPGSVTCDLFDNCGDWSDEKVNTCGLSQGGKIAVGVVCGIVGAALIGFIVFYIYTKKKEKQLRERRRHENVLTYPSENGATVNYTPGQAEPPPPYTYSVVYDTAMPLSGDLCTITSQPSDTGVNIHPPAYSEHDLSSTAIEVATASSSHAIENVSNILNTIEASDPDARRNQLTSQENVSPSTRQSNRIEPSERTAESDNPGANGVANTAFQG